MKSQTRLAAINHYREEHDELIERVVFCVYYLCVLLNVLKENNKWFKTLPTHPLSAGLIIET